MDQAAPLGAVWQSIVTKTANYTLNSTDYTVRADTTNGNLTITLPSNPIDGRICNVKKVATANTLIITGNGAPVDGASSVSVTTLNQNTTVHYSSHDQAWSIL